MHQNELRPWRDEVGGKWEEVGTLQFEFLISLGLRPHHTFLDIGCGCLRGGVHFIPYLEEGRYHGIDKEQWLLDAGRYHELKDRNIKGHRAKLLCREDFDFSLFNTTFDYAIAQSVFTHVEWKLILRCLYNIKKVLKPAGRFFATFFEDPDGLQMAASIEHSPGRVMTYPDQDPFHYEFSVFVDLATRVHLDVEYIGDWNHSRAQKMMVFRHPE